MVGSRILGALQMLEDVASQAANSGLKSNMVETRRRLQLQLQALK